MAAIPGSVTVTGFIAPTDTTDIYPTQDPLYGIDGYRSVADYTELNAITTPRRREGMLAFVQATTETWRLLAGPWTGTITDWQLIAVSPSGGLTPVALVLATPVVVDSVLVDAAGDVRWNLSIYNPTTGVRYSWSIDASNDGTAASDATDAAWTITGLGPDSADVIDVTLLGVGAAQAMRLVVTAAAAGFSAQVSRSVLSAGAS